MNLTRNQFGKIEFSAGNIPVGGAHYSRDAVAEPSLTIAADAAGTVKQMRIAADFISPGDRTAFALVIPPAFGL